MSKVTSPPVQVMAFVGRAQPRAVQLEAAQGCRGLSLSLRHSIPQNQRQRNTERDHYLFVWGVPMVLGMTRLPVVYKNGVRRSSRKLRMRLHAVQNEAPVLPASTVMNSEIEQPGSLRAAWASAYASPKEDVLHCLLESQGDEQVHPVFFERVSVEAQDGDVVLYLPSLEFTGIFAVPQFKTLAKEGHEIWRCFVPTSDRTSTFAQLEQSILTWVRRQLNANRRVVLLGEDFGGLIALSLALQLGKQLKGIVLVNPATSFEQSAWRSIGRSAPIRDAMRVLKSVVSNSDGSHPSPYSFLGMLGASSDSQVSRTAVRGIAGFLGGRSVIAAGLVGTLDWRLRAWVRDGWEAVESALRRTPQPNSLPRSLLICSTDDRLLPSQAEAKLLRHQLEKRCGKLGVDVQELEGAGHEPLADVRIDVAALLRDSVIYKPRKKRNYVTDFQVPSLEEVEKESERVERFAGVLSPVFLSTTPGGVREFGLSNVPEPASVHGRPVLLVGNHQLVGLDLGPLIREFIVEKGIIVRGLAHPNAFQVQENTLEKFGAVPVTPRNIFRLLQRGEMALLFPGGAREALHGPNEEYQLFWPAKPEFVRVAARFNAVVVPFGGVGIDDNIASLAQITEIMRPFESVLPARRRSLKVDGGGLMPVSETLKQEFGFPLLAPRLQPVTDDTSGVGDRYYMSFGKPVDLESLDPSDQPGCEKVYQELRSAVQGEIDWLLDARLKDPFREPVRRQLFERVANLDSAPKRIEAGPLKGECLKSYGKRAPSFPLPGQVKQ